MKKILFLLIVSLSFFTEASANLRFVNVNNSGSLICDMDYNFYEVYYMNVSSKELFFLNYSQNYNLAFDQYYEIDINDTVFSKNILDYIDKISILKSNGIYYREVITKKIWEEIYGQNFEICNPQNSEVLRQINSFDSLIANSNETYFNNKIDFVINSSQVLNNLSNYEMIDDNGLDVKINNNNIVVKGEPGEYSLKFKKKITDENSFKLYTDGENYIIKEGDNKDKVYTLNIKLDFGEKAPEEELEELEDLVEEPIEEPIMPEEDTEDIPPILNPEEEIIDDPEDTLKPSEEIELPTNTVIKDIVDKVISEPIKSITIIKPNKNEEIKKDEDKLVVFEEDNKLVVVLPDTLCH